MSLKNTRALPLLFPLASLALVCEPAWAETVAVPTDTVVKTDNAWRGSINGGVSAASGDTSSVSVNLSATLDWASPTDKFTSALTGLYGTSTSDGTKSVSNNLVTLNTEYDHDLSDRVYALGLFNAKRNELQDLNFQASAGGGFGYHVVKTAPTLFDVYTGLSYNYEQYKEGSRNYPELLLGENLVQKIGSKSAFNERVSVYPNLGYLGDLRTQVDLGLTTAINDHFQLKMTLSNSYQNHPLNGVKKVDTVFMTSIGYTFGPK
ncbi:DUF481 domain-containing protein [Paraburkholderia sp.]|uniref:DUF481 domain-containing protein n=1 Tax=Paraburkholderia sp. TaxID=1926495 RepID=UPI00238702F9|nr:DUF481 domain-containing protein [Paraburkholderia sp.]MDE1182152.1 DUF481 domain-containing protein [Paraburkholderia sp.]